MNLFRIKDSRSVVPDFHIFPETKKKGNSFHNFSSVKPFLTSLFNKIIINDMHSFPEKVRDFSRTCGIGNFVEDIFGKQSSTAYP